MTERSEGYEHSASKAGTSRAVASRVERSGSNLMEEIYE